MKSFLIQSLSLTALLVIVGCSKPAATVTEAAPVSAESANAELVLAQVGDTPLTESDFRRYWKRKAPSIDDAATRSAILDDAVNRQILVERARALGLVDDPIVHEAIESALIARLKEQELQPKIAAVAVSDETLRAAYDAQLQTRFTIGPQVRVAVLWLNSRGQKELEDRYQPRLKALTDAIASIPAKEGFGKLAIANTEHRASRYRGGIIDALEVGKTYSDSWRQQILNIATSLNEPGEVSAVTSNAHGTFIVRLIDRSESTQRPFAHVKAGLRETLIREKRQSAAAAFEAANRAAVQVTQFSERLDNLPPLPTRPREQAPPSMFAGEVTK